MRGFDPMQIEREGAELIQSCLNVNEPSSCCIMPFHVSLHLQAFRLMFLMSLWLHSCKTPGDAPFVLSSCLCQMKAGIGWETCSTRNATCACWITLPVLIWSGVPSKKNSQEPSQKLNIHIKLSNNSDCQWQTASEWITNHQRQNHWGLLAVAIGAQQQLQIAQPIHAQSRWLFDRWIMLNWDCTSLFSKQRKNNQQKRCTVNVWLCECPWPAWASFKVGISKVNFPRLDDLEVVILYPCLRTKGMC